MRSWGWTALGLAVFAVRSGIAAPTLDEAAVRRIIGQAVAQAAAAGLPVAIAVVDHEGNILGTHVMAGAACLTQLTAHGPKMCDQDAPSGSCMPVLGKRDCGLEGALVPSLLAAISKAGTAAFLSTDGNAFTTRTAGFIVQQHFPPQVENAPGGPLFGVQFSQLPCGDVIPRAGVSYPSPLPPLSAGVLPLGFSADPGGLPLYIGGHAVGGVGVEGNGTYTADPDPQDRDVTKEDRIASAATRGFEAPPAIRAERILVGGVSFPFDNLDEVPVVAPASVPFASSTDVTPRPSPGTRFTAQRLGGVRGTVDPRYFPPVDGAEPSPSDGGLNATEVSAILTRAARRADRLRAAIRRPLGDRARVNISVVDRAGQVLGIFRTADAAVFGFDVAVQKARTAAFFSRADAGARLHAADVARDDPGVLGAYLTAAGADRAALDGGIAFSARGLGFLARPFFPDGIDGTPPGPFSKPIGQWTPLNDGLQVDLLLPALGKILSGAPLPSDCTDGRIAGLGNGIQIFAGGVPLYRGRLLIGAIGVSGDGIDQDDAVALAGSRGLQAPRDLRDDRVRVRGVRLPYVKLPRRPETR